MNNKANNSEETKAAAPAYQNQVRLVGFIGNQPEQYEDRTVFSMATQSSWKTAGSEEWEHETEWHRIVAWGKLASATAVLAKGDHVLVEGELRSSTYDRVVAVVGGGQATTIIKSWDIRARAVRKLVRKKKKKPASS